MAQGGPELSPNVHLLTLQALPHGQLLLRLAHLYQVAGTPQYQFLAVGLKTHVFIWRRLAACCTLTGRCSPGNCMIMCCTNPFFPLHMRHGRRLAKMRCCPRTRRWTWPSCCPMLPAGKPSTEVGHCFQRSGAGACPAGWAPVCSAGVLHGMCQVLMAAVDDLTVLSFQGRER
jgi:hypothetical protein